MTTQSRFSIDNIQFSRLVLMEEKYLRGYISKKLYNLSDLDDAYQTTHNLNLDLLLQNYCQ